VDLPQPVMRSMVENSYRNVSTQPDVMLSVRRLTDSNDYEGREARGTVGGSRPSTLLDLAPDAVGGVSHT